MQFLNYLLVSIAAYLGIAAGYVLMLAAPEEKKPGMKYFNMLNYFLFFLSIIFSIFFRQSIFFIIFIILFSLCFYLLREYQIYIAYLLFSVLFYIFSESYMHLFSVIIFAYGLSAGAVIFDLKDKKGALFKVLSFAYFILAANLLKLAL